MSGPEPARPPPRIEDECRRSSRRATAQRVWRKLVTIQVVVHVVYKTDEENISDEQIQSQIDVLNADYRAHQPRPRATSRPRGRASSADPNIQFALATKDPKGKATNGITRVADRRATRSAPTTTVKSKASGGVAAVADRPVPQPLGLQPRRRPARLRAVPRRARRRPTAS